MTYQGELEPEAVCHAAMLRGRFNRGTARKELVVAGYIQTVEAWGKFAEDWDAVLRADPPIAYLKMKDALPRAGQFKGFSEGARNRKIFALADVIEHHAPWSLHVRVSVSEFKRRVRPVAPYPAAYPLFPDVFRAGNGRCECSRPDGDIG